MRAVNTSGIAEWQTATPGTTCSSGFATDVDDLDSKLIAALARLPLSSNVIPSLLSEGYFWLSDANATLFAKLLL